jgi:glucuronoarabinoxylan endo-1,4-beta-xylanase
MSIKRLNILIVSVSFLSLINVFGDGNILDNPGFERGKDNWFDRTCKIEAVATPVHNGTGSCKAYERLQNWQGIKQSVFGKMIDGQTYKVSGWIRLENSKLDTVAISFEQQDENGTRYYGVARGAVTDTGWIQLSGEFTLHVKGTLSVLDIYFEGPKPGVNFFIDDVKVWGPETNAQKLLPAKPQGKGEIDVTKHLQKLEGFGASGAYYTIDLIQHKKCKELIDILFKDLGLDIFRIRNTYDMDSSTFKETIIIAKLAQSVLGKKLKILCTSWTPPVYLKSNDNKIGGTLKKKNGKYMYDEFADWWCKSILAYKKAGLNIDYISIQNEVDYEAPWESCKFSPSDKIDTTLAAYNIAFEKVWHKLNSELGSDMPKMLAVESSGLGNAKAYVENMDMSHVYGISTHLYDCSGCGYSPDRFIPRMKSLNNLVSKYGNKPYFQTEFEEDPGTWTDALNTSLVIYNTLNIAKASAYLYWDLFWAPGTALLSLDDSLKFTIKPTYYAMKQYSYFLAADWHMVDASTDDTGLRISAFTNPDNKKITVVILNITEDVDISLDLTVKNFSNFNGEIYRSSKTENCKKVGSYNGKGKLKIPKSSITTLSLSLQ